MHIGLQDGLTWSITSTICLLTPADKTEQKRPTGSGFIHEHTSRALHEAAPHGYALRFAAADALEEAVSDEGVPAGGQPHLPDHLVYALPPDLGVQHRRKA